MASSSNPSRADAFPAGLRVLVVDDDLTWLKILEKMLRKCSYEVTTCSLARAALDMLREKRDRFDIVISDVNMPDMDGFKLLEQVGLEMDLPVIMMSVDGETSRVMNGVQHGACDYLLKPIRMKELKNIWQHVFRKKIHEGKEVESHDGIEEFQLMRNTFNELDDMLLFFGSDLNFSKKRKDVTNIELAEQDFLDPSSVKKARVVWSMDLHHKFVDAVNQIGFDKVGPKKILDLMNVPGLTRENVASHLQKYRLYLSRLQRENEGVACEGGAQSDVTHKDPMGSFCFQSSTSSMQNSPDIDMNTGEREHTGVPITESEVHFDNHFDNIAVKEEETITVIASKSLETKNVKWLNAPCTPPKSSRPTLEKILHEPSISNFNPWSDGTDLQPARCRVQHDLFSLLSGYPHEQQLEDRDSSDGLLPITPSVTVSRWEEVSLSKLTNINYCENRMTGIPTSQCRSSSVAHQIDTEGKEVSKSSMKSIIMDMTSKNVGSPNIKITYPDRYLIDLIESSSQTSNLTDELTVSPSPDNAYCSLDDYGYFEQNGNDSLETPQYDSFAPTNLSGNLNESLQFDCDYAFELTEYSTTGGGLFT